MRFVPAHGAATVLPEHICLPVYDGDLLLHPDGAFPTVATAGEVTDRWQVGTFDGVPVWTGQARAPGMLVRHSWKSAAAHLAEPAASMAARAMAVSAWRRAHRYCGACRTELADVPGVTGRRCPACGLNLPMALQPVVLVAVRRGDEVLLVRHAGAHSDIWALIGGFVEAGETLEDAARREVAEEVGIEITDIRYHATQPWGLHDPNLLLATFTAHWLAHDPTPDGTELTEARWFPLTALPSALPPPYSVARHVLDHLTSHNHQ